jgi:hypothetical protein
MMMAHAVVGLTKDDRRHRSQASVSSSGSSPGFDLERARIGRLRVGLGRVVSDLLEREGREFGGEFA